MPATGYQCCEHCDHEDEDVPLPHANPCSGDDDKGCAEGSTVITDAE
jgi:hypothetical protein